MGKPIFDHSDCGCYADGANGQEHARAVMADLVIQSLGPLSTDEHARAVVAELTAPMSDDASEEDDAADILNSVTDTEDGIGWGWEEGNWGLWCYRENCEDH